MPIDWAALLARAASPRDRAALEDLQSLDRLRALSATERPATTASSRRSVALGALMAVAAFQVVLGLGAALTAAMSGQSLGLLAPRLLLTIAFGGAALLLGAASPRDTRCLFLSATYVFAAGAFAREVPAALGLAWPGSIAIAFRGVFPEALAPAALWQFATAFPAVKRFAASDLLARRAAAAAWALGSVLFAINIALVYGLVEAPLAVRLGRNDESNLFWHLFAAASLPALGMIFIRARRSAGPERQKTRRFAMALVAGAAPFALSGVARMAWPSLNSWLAAAEASERLWFDVSIVGTLACLPLATTLAVLVDRPFGGRVALPARLHPHRRPVLTWFFDGLSMRQAGARDRLAAILERLARTRGSRELMAILRRELQFGAGAANVRTIDPSSSPAGTALISMLEESAGVLDVSRDGELFALLPRRDREWLESNDVAVVAAVKRRDDSIATVIGLGPKSDGSRFTRVDGWFISTAIAAAAVAWDSFEAGAAPRDADAEPALECPACGTVAEREPLPCACGRAAELAAVPLRLAGKFDVLRRLGSGGMGVVYLARDAVLGRKVALKTLPELRDGTVSRLTAEARAMSGLNHEALATIYGVELWRRTPVLVVEYFPQGTLADTLARGPIARTEAVAIGLRLAGALSYMHARGVLHRDIKPSNIGLTETGAAKLLDFGLAAERRPFAGTREYLPPEALRGESPDAAVDLWGLATVLQKMCGTADTVPAPLAAFFDRALSPDAAARYQSIDEFRCALARLAQELADR